LLLPADIVPRYATYSEKLGLLAVTHDRRFMRWTKDTAGGEQLTATVPAGRVEGVFADDALCAAYGRL